VCASYGLDPRFTDKDEILAQDLELLDGLRSWAERNDGRTLYPTGKDERNLNPIVRDVDGRRELELAWWGYLINGLPAKFPSINTKSERLIERGGNRGRAIAPATMWFEMQKPQRQWFRFSGDDAQLFAMAAVTQNGRTLDGARFTCYSLVMRPALDRVAEIHDRSPLLIPVGFVSEWLTSDAPTQQLVDQAVKESEAELGKVAAAPIAARP
jgi:putative SOS response-associated peptidase YedK